MQWWELLALSSFMKCTLAKDRKACENLNLSSSFALDQLQRERENYIHVPQFYVSINETRTYTLE